MAYMDDDAYESRVAGGATDEDSRRSDEQDGPLGDLDVQRIVHAALTDAVQYTDEQLSPDRAKKTDYYFGRPFGDEEDNRSQVVSTDVRDSVLSVLPSLLRVFFGPERVVEFVPTRADYAEQAAQETDYVQYVFEEEQGGFLKTHSVLKDGLIRGIGVFKWWWEPEVARVEELQNLTMDQVVQLQMDSDAEVMSVTPEPMPRRWTMTKVKQALGMAEADQQLFTVEVKYTDRDGHPCVEAVPPEEFVSSRQARGMDRALCIAHRTEMTRSELVELGIDEADIDEWGAYTGNLLFANPEEIARRDGMTVVDPKAGTANDKVLYCEAYIPLDVDGDGIAELRRCCTIGPAYHVVHHEPVDSVPMAMFCPDPEPHVIYGQAWSDRTMDIQRIKSSLLRAINDSAALSSSPRMAVVEGHVSIADVLNNEIGAIIRQDMPGQVQPLTVPFIGADLMPVVSYFDDLTERRTGRNKAAAGLDADALQSTTKSAADAAIQGSQDQLELLARIFAEQALKPLFKGLRQLFLRYQPRKRMIRLRGRMVEVDPRVWDADCDVTVNVGLGSSMTTGRQQALMAIVGKQEQILSTLGIQQPLVTPQQYSYALRKLIETFGIKDVDNYVSAVPQGWQPPPQQPQETPEQTIAKAQLQIEQMKAQKDIEIKQAELTLKAQQQQLDADLKVKQIASDEMIRLYQIDAQFKSTMTQAQLESDATAQEQWLDAQRAGHEQAIATHEAALAQQQQAQDQQQAEAQAQAESGPQQPQPGNGE